ncbi:MAG: hypothetical protein IME97_06740 [Proteobacteria bacterium]|nr:hypothetical protein [Pseudomonadota bacterium]
MPFKEFVGLYSPNIFSGLDSAKLRYGILPKAEKGIKKILPARQYFISSTTKTAYWSRERRGLFVSLFKSY